MNETDTSAHDRNAQIINAVWAISSAQSDLGRAFAQRMHMHPTDATAIVEIIRAEDRGQPLTPARLSERIGLTSGATSILLNRLEVAGHVVRTRGHADRRLVTLNSSPAVHEAGDRFFDDLRSDLGAILGNYTAEQLALIEHFVNEFLGTVDEYSRASTLRT